LTGRPTFALGDQLWAIHSEASRLVRIDLDSLEVAAEVDLGGIVISAVGVR